jgi:nicotinamide-nucleotide adenylyltransferase
MRGLVIGRFQPFHKGHLSVIREVLGECDDVVVVIGSAEESHTAANPFTAGERYQMIFSSLTPAERARVHMIPIRDVNRYAAWVNHVESYVPPFDVVYSNSDLTRSLFSEAGYTAKKTREYDMAKYSGTEIRCRIASGGKWRQLVPAPVAGIVEALDGRQRLLDAGLRPGKRGRTCLAR